MRKYLELTTLKLLCPPQQYKAILASIIKGGAETADFWDKKEQEIAAVWRFMPTTYQTQGQGRNALARLHFIRGSAEWWITEKDSAPEQNQMFGIADLGFDCREYGYVSLDELKYKNAELDLYWEPKTAREILNETAPL